MQTVKFAKVRKTAAQPIDMDQRSFGKKTKFVNVHLVDRACGGPEEGGWWYNYGDLEVSIPAPNRTLANTIKSALENGEYTNKGRRPIYSVNSRGEYWVTVDKKMGSDWSDYRDWE
jgi:hypothetical protein